MDRKYGLYGSLRLLDAEAIMVHEPRFEAWPTRTLRTLAVVVTCDEQQDQAQDEPKDPSDAPQGPVHVRVVDHGFIGLLMQLQPTWDTTRGMDPSAQVKV